MSPIARQFLLESLLVPSIVALVILLIGHPVLRRLPLSPSSAGVALVAGLCAGIVATRGWAALLPGAAVSKLPTLALIGLLVGSVLERQRNGSLVRPVSPLFAALVVGWLAWPRFDGAASAALATLLGLWGALALIALEAARPAPARPLAMMLAAAFGLAAVAFFAPAISVMQLALAIAGALLAITVVACMTGGGRLRADALLPAASALLGLGTILALFSSVPRMALVPIALIPASDRLADWLSRIVGWREQRAFALLCLILPVLAAVIGRMLGTPPPGF